MADDMKLIFEQNTKLSAGNKKKLVNWFNKQNILVQTDIFKEQKNQFFKLSNTSNSEASNELMALSAFYLSIDDFYQKEQIIKKKNTSQNLSSLKGVSTFAIKQAKKDKYIEKREKLLNKWSTVKELKEQSYSYREISKYLSSKHRFEVSHTYIQKQWKELEND